MVQRIFYGKQSSLVLNRPAFDLDFREHITLWPMAILMLTMGVLSPYWIKGIQSGVLQFPIDVTQTTVVAQRHAHGFVSTHMLPAPTPADAQKLMGGVQ
jgi:NADH-quinone oxidoreductase subunit M